MTIDQMANHFKVTKSKLRYYEKEGIIKNIKTNESGKREYTEADKTWIEFFLNLKETGMTLREIRYYIDLKKDGEKTIEERKQILKDQAENIQNKIEDLLNTKEEIEHQISKYDLEKGNCIIVNEKNEKKC